jgi:hypothetical protein
VIDNEVPAMLEHREPPPGLTLAVPMMPMMGSLAARMTGELVQHVLGELPALGGALCQVRPYGGT